MDKIRVLYVLDYLSDSGGVQGVMNNIYESLDKSLFRIDFLVALSIDGEYENLLRRAGSKIYYLEGIKEKKIIKYWNSVLGFFSQNNDFDIVHIHQTYFDSMILYAAKKNKIPVRIVHGHSTKIAGRILRYSVFRLFNYFDRFFATNFYACTQDAGVFLFGKNIVSNPQFKIFANSIECDKYAYNSRVRKEIRQDLGMESYFVVAIVGRITIEKNHKFFLEIINDILRLNQNVYAVIVGDGEQLSEIQYDVKKREMEKRVVFLGKRKDVEKILQGVDAIVMPSLYEGFPLVSIEAQCAGLPCILSNTITREVNITGDVIYLPLTAGSKCWAETINMYTDFIRKDKSFLIRERGYDCHTQMKELESDYYSLLREKTVDIEGR